MAVVLGKGSTQPALTDKLLFITTTTCPYAQRTWIALNEAGVPYDAVYVDLDNKPEWLFTFNPLGKVPTIVRKTGSSEVQHAYESLVLNELVAELAPGGSKLLPEDPFERAHVRIATDAICNKALPPFMRLMFAKDAQQVAAAQEACQAEVDWLAGQIKGPYVMGEDFTLADCALAPWVLRLPVFQALKGCTLSCKGLAKVQAYGEALMARPSVQASIVLPDGEGDYVQHLIQIYTAWLAARM